MARFLDIGYVSETKKSQEGQGEKTYMLTIKPSDQKLAEITLNKGAKIMLRAPSQGKLSDEQFAKITEWKLFSATLIIDDDQE